MLTITITNTLQSKVRNGGGGGGTPPVNTVAPVISGTGIIFSTLSCTDGIWTGSPVISFSYQWKRNGIDIPGETNTTYVLDNADYGNVITCEVTGVNLYGTSSAISNAITGTAIAPVNTVPPVISGTNVVGSTLTTTKGTWTVDPSPLYTYQWYRGASQISGATSETYILVQADAAQSITCVVTATNIAGSASATSNALTITDADAQAFFTASGLTGATNLTAINQLVVDLKGYNLWTKMKAIYPFVGGTAALHKWNLKDPQDTNAAFRLTFSGGWTHSSTGALPNGTNGYANTFISPISVFTPLSISIASYNKDATGTTGFISGCQTSTSQTLRHQILTGFHALRTPNLNSTNVAFVAGGFNGGSRTSSILAYAMNSIGTTTTDTGLTTNSFPTAEIALACLMNVTTPGSYSTSTYSFYSAGDGLSISEMTTLRTIVINYQTTLGRV